MLRCVFYRKCCTESWYASDSLLDVYAMFLLHRLVCMLIGWLRWLHGSCFVLGELRVSSHGRVRVVHALRNDPHGRRWGCGAWYNQCHGHGCVPDVSCNEACGLYCVALWLAYGNGVLAHFWSCTQLWSIELSSDCGRSSFPQHCVRSCSSIGRDSGFVWWGHQFAKRWILKIK